MVFEFLIRKGSESFPNLISLRFVGDIGTCHFNDSRDNILMNYEMLLFGHMFARKYTTNEKCAISYITTLVR